MQISVFILEQWILFIDFYLFEIMCASVSTGALLFQISFRRRSLFQSSNGIFISHPVKPHSISAFSSWRTAKWRNLNYSWLFYNFSLYIKMWLWCFGKKIRCNMKRSKKYWILYIVYRTGLSCSLFATLFLPAAKYDSHQSLCQTLENKKHPAVLLDLEFVECGLWKRPQIKINWIY